MPEQNNEQWEEMLRAIMGDSADEVIRSMKESGLDPSAMGAAMSPEQMRAVTSQLQAMLGSHGEGPVNWKIAEEVARDTIIRTNMDSLSAAQGDKIRSALSVASLWLDAVTDVDPTTGPNLAWTRLDWIAHSLPTFKKLLDPLGTNINRAFGDVMREQLAQLPPEMSGLMSDPEALLGSMISSFLGMQYGSALAQLASSSFGTADIGLPLMEGSSAALVNSNITEFAAELEDSEDDVRMYIAVREAAASRLFTSIPWLRSRIIDTVAEYARGIEIDMSSIEEQARAFDFSNPEAMQDMDFTGVFSMEQSAAQKDALARLEHLLSLIDGWVAAVSARAVLAYLPSAAALREMFARRNATSHPAKAVWGSQLGVELAPRHLRSALAFWERATRELGDAGRDRLWTHPDLLPTAEQLADPQLFFSPEAAAIEEELDSFLSELLDGEDNTESGSTPA
ncbi:zinc-dependent metalloprotease [Arcanobacterium phocisimile]|uniref:Zinc-dependent metalloprotease n=1 Tax=Arcanobacterium phocisimile TaxID=1302235 RepID=A0ABX7IHE3_9ACTO|nr:zinc-dependent metalloprotease [Arcanobacterium phocisimile]QRV02556.1 zinc-dependent metalloprotease [Arcanobacterium phocisimile]